MERFNLDDPRDAVILRERTHTKFYPQAFPRAVQYGSRESISTGYRPIVEFPSVLVPESDWKAALQESHDTKSQPMYHMYHTWRPQGERWNQNGIGYCWTWSGTAGLMTLRAIEDKDTVELGPVSMGYLVGWRDRGNYLDSFIQGCRNDGIVPVEFFRDYDRDQHNPRLAENLFKEGWQEARRLYRLDELWDCDPAQMTKHCVSGITYGRCGYIAYNWWGHAVLLVGIRMKADGSLEWLICNSHNETDLIILEGKRAIPSECYFFVSTK